MSDDASTVGRQMAKASGWTVTSRVLIRVIGLASTAMLARLLVPADFGVVAMAMLVYQIIAILGEFNFNMILLVERKAGDDYYDTVWTLSLIRGAAIAVVLTLLGAPVAALFHEPRVETIVYFLAFVALLEGTANVGIVEFQKQFRFGRDLTYNVAIKCSSFVVGIAAAFALRSYVALLLGILAGTSARVALSFAMHPYRPRLSLARWGEVLAFSRWLLFANIIRTMYRRADAFLLSKLFGASTLGVYSMAFEVASLPAELLILPVQRALLPGYAKLADNPEQLRKVHANGFALMLLVVLPAAVGLALTADPLVRLLLGEPWLGVVPLLQVLAFLGCFRALSSNLAPLFLALGRPEVVTWLAVLVFVLGVPLIVMGAYVGGPFGIASFVTLAGGINAILTFLLATRLLGIGVMHILAPVWRVLAATAMMCVPVALVAAWWGEPSAYPLLLAKLLTQVAAGFATFTTIQWLLWRLSSDRNGPERLIVETFRSWRAGWKPSPGSLPTS